MAIAASPMTSEEPMAIPEDGVDRWLIDGELRERPVPRRRGIEGTSDDRA